MKSSSYDLRFRDLGPFGMAPAKQPTRGMERETNKEQWYGTIQQQYNTHPYEIPSYCTILPFLLAQTKHPFTVQIATRRKVNCRLLTTSGASLLSIIRNIPRDLRETQRAPSNLHTSPNTNCYNTNIRPLTGPKKTLLSCAPQTQYKNGLRRTKAIGKSLLLHNRPLWINRMDLRLLPRRFYVRLLFMECWRGHQSGIVRSRLADLQ